MQVAIFQFSGTGNTWYVAKQLQAAFLHKGHPCDLYSLENDIDIDALIKKADIIGIGYPIYGSNFPKPIGLFLDRLKTVEQKRAFVFCTQMMYSGDGAVIAAKRLRKKGFLVRQLMHINMPNNITDFRIVRWVKPMKEAKLTDKVARKTHTFSDAIINDKRKRKGEGVGSLLLGLMQRVPLGLIEPKSSSLLKVDNRCIACGLCVKLCPSGHLSLRDNHLVMGNTCYLCYRCLNHCPTKALHVAKKTQVKRPYLGPVSDFKIDDVRRNIRLSK